MSSNIRNINYDDFKNLCRICMFDCGIKFNQDSVVSNIYHKLTELQFETNDDLPKHICLKCFNKINDIHEFMFQCLRTHDVLMECLNNYKQKQLNEVEEVTSEKQDGPDNTNILQQFELVINLGRRVIVEEKHKPRNNHDVINMEIDQNIELYEDLVPETREFKEELIENTDLEEISYHLEDEITIEEHKIEFVKDEHVIDKASEIKNEQNILESNKDLLTTNTSNINSGSDEDSDNCCTSSDVVTDNLNFANISNDPNIKSKKNKKNDSNEKEATQTRTSESNDSKRSYKCPKCPKSYTRSSALKKHMHTHTGDYPFKCHQCSKSFTNSYSWKTHMRSHTGERPFKCDQCPKAYIELGSLHKHMRIHTGERLFKCDQCSKLFAELSGLHKHMRTHNGERPFKCIQCCKSFTESGNLHKHMRTHTGKRPFKCDQCSKSFNETGNLLKHMRTHTRE